MHEIYLQQRSGVGSAEPFWFLTGGVTGVAVAPAANAAAAAVEASLGAMLGGPARLQRWVGVNYRFVF